MTHHWVTFECGHRAALLDEEFGDGSAWCQQCADFQVYQDADDAADAANDALFADAARPVFVASKIGGGSSASVAATRDSGALRTVPTPDIPAWRVWLDRLAEGWFGLEGEHTSLARSTLDYIESVEVQAWEDVQKINEQAKLLGALRLDDDAAPQPGDNTVLGS